MPTRTILTPTLRIGRSERNDAFETRTEGKGVYQWLGNSVAHRNHSGGESRGSPKGTVLVQDELERLVHGAGWGVGEAMPEDILEYVQYRV